jgi:hypothetical protein
MSNDRLTDAARAAIDNAGPKLEGRTPDHTATRGGATVPPTIDPLAKALAAVIRAVVRDELVRCHIMVARNPFD